jgi:hypothetical protein
MFYDSDANYVLQKVVSSGCVRHTIATCLEGGNGK